MKSFVQQVLRLASAIITCYRHTIGLWYLGFFGLVGYLNYAFRNFEQLNFEQYKAGDFTTAMILLCVYNAAFSAYFAILFQPKKHGSWIYEIPVRSSVFQLAPMLLLAIHCSLIVAFLADFWFLYMNLMGVSPFIILFVPSLMIATATLRFAVTWQRQLYIFIAGILYFWFVQSALQPWTHQFGQWKAELHILGIVFVLTVLVYSKRPRYLFAPAAAVCVLSILFVSMYAICTMVYPSQNPVERAASASYFRNASTANRFVESFLSKSEGRDQDLFHENQFLNDRFAVAMSRLSSSSMSPVQNELIFKKLDRMDIIRSPLVEKILFKQYLRLTSNEAINLYLRSNWRGSPFQCLYIDDVFANKFDQFLEQTLFSCGQSSFQTVPTIVRRSYRPWLEIDQSQILEQLITKYLGLSSPLERERIMRELYSMVRQVPTSASSGASSSDLFQVNDSPEILVSDWKKAFVQSKKAQFERAIITTRSLKDIFRFIDRNSDSYDLEMDICYQVLDRCDDLNLKFEKLNPYQRFYFSVLSFFSSGYSFGEFRRWYITQHGDLTKLDALVRR